MAIRLSRPARQWAQMTYTSADSPHAPGGWGVKETTADLTASMVERLMSGVSTRLDGIPELSTFPSDRELEARPRRLAYSLVDGRVTLWHAVEAGNDASGRPGNVFAHIATETAQGTATRPIQYWRSPDWLVPFGAPEVANARIPSSLSADGVVNPDAFLDFIKVGDRLFVLRWLLDAVSWAVRTSSCAVLLTETPDQAVGWLAAFSYLTAPQLAQQMSFVTFERAHTLSLATLQGFHVICVPRVDVARLVEMSEPFLLLDPRWDLDERAAAERTSWTLPTGRSVPTTCWQEWALDLASLDREHALAVLAATEKVGGQLPAGAEVPLHWPLAVAMMLDEQSVIMAREEKIQEILGFTPSEVLGLPACTALVDELVRTLDAEGWRSFLAANRDRAALCELATARLLTCVLRSPSETDPAMVMTPMLLTGRSRAELRKPVLEAVARAATLAAGAPEDVMEAARITGVLLSMGLQPVPENDVDIPALEPVVDRLRLQLRSPELASRSGDVARLHPQLTSDSRIQATEHGEREARARARTSPPRHHGPAAPSLDVAPHERMGTSSDSWLRDQICDDIAQIFYGMPAGTPECAAIARAVYVAAGLGRGDSPTVDELARKPFLALACANSLVGPDQCLQQILEHAEQIIALNREPSASRFLGQPHLSAAMQRALTCVAVLQCLRPESALTEAPSVEIVARLVEAQEEAHVAALVHLFAPGPEAVTEPATAQYHWAARLIVASAQAEWLGDRSALTIRTGGGDCLGLAVSRRLVRSTTFSATRLRDAIDSQKSAITDERTRAQIHHRISDPMVPTLWPWPVIDANPQRS
jgi:hypothetical protein